MQNSGMLFRAAFVAMALPLLQADLTLNGDGFQVSFEDDPSRASFGTAIVFRSTKQGSDTGNLIPEASKSPQHDVWQTQFVSKQTTTPIAISSSCGNKCNRSAGPGATKDSASFKWEGVSVNGESMVDVTMYVVATDVLSLSLEVNVTDASVISLWTWSLRFPLVLLSSPSYLLDNRGFGNAHQCPGSACASYTPSESEALNIQMLAAYGLGDQLTTGVYFAAHDPEGSTKALGYVVDQGAGTASFQASATPADAGLLLASGAASKKKSWKSPYPVVAAIFQGDWFDAAKIYSAWALPNAKWTQKGPISQRVDTPKWMLNLTTWVNSHWQDNDVFNTTGGDPEVVKNRVTAIVQRFAIDPPPALHWYEWDTLGYKLGSNYTECETEITCGFDTHYPEYFPVRQGFQDALAAMQGLGVRVAPYINGRIFDQATKSWTDDSAADSACKNSPPTANSSQLSLYDESYGSKAKFAVMCPHTPYWQGTIAGTVGKLVTQFKTDGVYVDQIAAAGPRPCWDPTHHHPIGGGSHWQEGYRTMLSKARNQIGNDAVILTESNSEPYMDGVNYFLTLVAFGQQFSGDSRIVPLFPAVYGGYYTAVGAEFYVDDFSPSPNVFAAKLAKMLAMGAQMGWFSLGGRNNSVPSSALFDLLMDSRYDAEIDYLRNLAAAKASAQRYFVEGRAMRDLLLVINGTSVSPSSPGKANVNHRIVRNVRKPVRSIRGTLGGTTGQLQGAGGFEVTDFHYEAITSAAWLLPSMASAHTHSEMHGNNNTRGRAAQQGGASLLVLLTNVERDGGTTSVSATLDMSRYGFPESSSQDFAVSQLFPVQQHTSTGAATYPGSRVEIAAKLAARSIFMFVVSPAAGATDGRSDK